MATSGRRDEETPTPAARIRVGECEVDLSLATICRRGRAVARIEPKAMAVLECLLERPRCLVTREELLERVWLGRIVTDQVLSRTVSILRKALGDAAGDPRYIETIPTRGYRLLVTPTRAIAAAPAAVQSDPAVRRSLPTRGTLHALAALSLPLALLAVSYTALRDSPPDPSLPVRVIPLRVGPGSEVDPAIAPDGKRVAFAWNRPRGGTDLYLSDLRGRSLRRLIWRPGREANPAWRPGAEQLAFSRSRGGRNGLYLLSLADGAERLLTPTVAHDIADLAWSPDGRHLWFSDRPHEAEASAIARLDVRSGRRRWITTPRSGIYGDRDLALSPDGRWLAFARAVIPGVEDLYVMTTAGDSTLRLTRDGASINGLAWIDDAEILFSSTRDGVSRLWRVSTPGGDIRPFGPVADDAFDPSYDVARNRLVFERRTFDTDVWKLSLNASTGPLRERISPSRRWDANPSVAPDGRSVAFITARGGASEVWLARPDASHATSPLGVSRKVVGRPAWSHDLRRVAVATLRAGQADLMLIDAATGAERLVASSASNEICPTFLPDGERILYSSDESGRWDLWVASLADGGRKPLLRGALCPQIAPDGITVFFNRPARRGIWRAPVTGGAASRVPATAHTLPWDDWAPGPDLLVVRPVADGRQAEASLVNLASPSSRRSSPLPLRTGAFAGLGASVAADGSFVAVAEASAEDSDLMLVEVPW